MITGAVELRKLLDAYEAKRGLDQTCECASFFCEHAVEAEVARNNLDVASRHSLRLILNERDRLFDHVTEMQHSANLRLEEFRAMRRDLEAVQSEVEFLRDAFELAIDSLDEETRTRVFDRLVAELEAKHQSEKGAEPCNTK